MRVTLLERDGIRLLELDDENGITPNDKGPNDFDSTPSIPMGRVTLRGEIIDPKCYCGAMKPGEGKTHKACATLCISGGIPPMFVTIDGEQNRTYYLLTDPAGKAVNEGVLPFVADAVEIAGSLEHRDDLCVLRIDPAGITRL